MNCYEVWADLAPGAKDLEFAASVREFMEHLQSEGIVQAWRLKRRKLGFGQPGLGEFWISMEFESLEDLDRAFFEVAPRQGEVERMHNAVWSRVRDFKSALYRDFPDSVRPQ
jgi:hypothetical protein